MNKTLIIDNYDSFVYNLVQYVWEMWWNPEVYRNNEINIEQILKLSPSHILISPWPWDPRDPEYFGICAEVISKLGQTIPVLWVCLWHQGIGMCFGWEILRCPEILHGKTSEINIHHDSLLFKWISKRRFSVMRYHSLIVWDNWLSSDILVTSRTDNWYIMSIEHKVFPIYGVQFHPESIWTPEGKIIISNFLACKR